ncbi:MAG: glycoside hydrolase family 65 [Deltaproteobacteria bacterium]|nr:glycoside hydrolase family 65 [Deltaproteobacteria bacterium]
MPARIIAFDWDGTAVESRRDDTTALCDRLERLLRMDVAIVVITGTNFANVARLLEPIQGKRGLYVATNRGSEVYGFDRASRPVLLFRRHASPDEERLLTEIADEVRRTLVSRTRLEIELVLDRLNRRKIDLIPLPEWRDPPKAAMGDLLGAVEARLGGAGLEGGLGEVVHLAEHVALVKGLADARVTSDVKHVEVGLTDKSDTIEWMMRVLAAPAGIPAEQILIVGDEFGAVGGLAGSDSKMMTQSAGGATFVSVGPEPSGVPPGVVHLRGGPARFLELLDEQITAHRAGDPLGLPCAAPADPRWLIVEDVFRPVREHEIESLFALSNGYLGTRAALEEDGPETAPATFIAGLYDVESSSGACPQLAVAPDWRRLSIRIEGQELVMDAGEILQHERVLDLRRGITWRRWRHRDASARVTRFESIHLASLADRHVLVQSVVLTPENYFGRIEIEARIEPPVDRPARVELVAAGRGPRTDDAGTPGAGPATTVVFRTGAGATVAFASRGRLRTSDGRTVGATVTTPEGSLRETWALEALADQQARLDRLVVVHTSRDSRRPSRAATEHLERLASLDTTDIVESHRAAWEERWRTADVEVDGDDDAQRALRFAGYHLIGASNPDDPRVSVGARALTGPAYSGHVFWDADVYMLPFYALTHPASARALLEYRHGTLAAARARARAIGCRGALFAWESADTGEETTPGSVVTPDGRSIRIRSGEQEHHISADVAHAVWRYWQWTGDDDFFLEAGAELLIETARFWASRGGLEPDGSLHIRNVIGPDEYHEDVDDSAYTNGMARWNLERGAETAAILAARWPERWRDLGRRLELEPGEAESWATLAKAMYTGLDPRTGVLEQFRGYFDLEEAELPRVLPRSIPVDMHLGRERTQRSKVVKQADVVMLVHLLWERTPAAIREASFRYYEPRTSHGSSLSPSIHAAVAARLGDVDLALAYFRQAAEIDLADNMGNAASGVHAGAMGGLWQAAVFGVLGLEARADGIAVDPKLLPGWQRLRVPVRWRGRLLRVTAGASPRTIEVELETGEPMAVWHGGKKLVVGPGQRRKEAIT